MVYTRAQVRDLIRRRCAIENTTAQVDAELNDHINDAASYAHDFLISTLGENYAVNELTVTTSAGVDDYAIPTNPSSGALDFYRPVSASLKIDDRYFPLMLFSRGDEVRQTTGESWGYGFLPRYSTYQQIDGTFRVLFSPPPQTTQEVKFSYHPLAPIYSADSDPVGIPYPDLLVMEACIRVKNKEERDPSYFLGERQMIEKRIEDRVGSIDMGGPAVTQVPGRVRRWHRRDRLF